MGALLASLVVGYFSCDRRSCAAGQDTSVAIYINEGVQADDFGVKEEAPRAGALLAGAIVASKHGEWWHSSPHRDASAPFHCWTS